MTNEILQSARVYLVATGEITNGLEQYTRHDTLPPMADYETLYTAPMELLGALKIARQFMSIAADWNVDEAEINGEMRSAYDWIAFVDAAIGAAK